MTEGITGVNLCEVLCPRRLFLVAEDRQVSTGIKAARRLGQIGLGSDMEQTARAMECPQRNLPADEWRPRSACVLVVQAAQTANPLDLAQLSDHERRVLLPHLQPPEAGPSATA